METRRAEWTVLAGAALVFAGCSKTVDHSCADRAAELATWADEVAREGHPFSIAALVDVSSASPRPDRIGSMAVITPTATAIDDHVVDTPEQIAAIFSFADTRRTPYAFAVDARASLEPVAAVAEGLIAAGGPRDVLVLVTHPANATPPKPSSITESLRALTPQPQPARFDGAIATLARVAERCPQLRAGWAAEDASAHNKPAAKAAAIRNELVECECNVDVDALRTGWWYAYGPGWGALGTISVTLASPDDPNAATITGATWTDAAPALVAAAAKHQPVRFRAPSPKR